MDRPDIPLNALRVFEVAMRQGSFTKAAIELRVTQAAVSHQIARLEDLLTVSTVITGRGGAWVEFEQLVARGDQVLVRGRIKCVALNPASGQPRRLPKALIALADAGAAPR